LAYAPYEESIIKSKIEVVGLRNT